MTLILPLADEAATAALAAKLAARARPGDALLLEGPLGAGKSAFARAFLRAASGDPGLEVPSPTFTLVQSYDLPAGDLPTGDLPTGDLPTRPAFHFDLWRLDGPDGIEELGWEEAREGISLIEWPDRLGPLRPEDALTITLAPGPTEHARVATLTGWAGRLQGIEA